MNTPMVGHNVYGYPGTEKENTIVLFPLRKWASKRCLPEYDAEIDDLGPERIWLSGKISYVPLYSLHKIP